MKRKICVVTGSRAEYGLLRWVMQGIEEHNDLQLQVVVTGSHLSLIYGNTYEEINRDGFTIHKKVPLPLEDDSASGVTKSIASAMVDLCDAFLDLQPDLVLILGDRYEIFAASVAALISRIPVAHVHGGELTEGAIDDALRHSITKMSQFHFVATDEYRKRVIQLGEDPTTVFNVGGLGIDCISKVKKLAKAEIEKDLNFKFQEKNLVVTFHPETLSQIPAEKQIDELITALDQFPTIGLIFTLPNADTNGSAIRDKIRRYVTTRLNAKAYESLGSSNYLSCLSLVDGVVGNSSSGILEAPTFKIGTVNIGDRQRGRLMSSSIINCQSDSREIVKAIQELFSKEFQHNLKNSENLYGPPGASDRIVSLLSDLPLRDNLSKKFFDLRK